MINSNIIREFLQDDLGLEEAENLSDDSPLFSVGLVDSFALVSLMALLENEGGIRISPSDVNIQNLDSIGQMLRFVESKQA